MGVPQARHNGIIMSQSRNKIVFPRGIWLFDYHEVRKTSAIVWSVFAVVFFVTLPLGMLFAIETIKHFRSMSLEDVLITSILAASCLAFAGMFGCAGVIYWVRRFVRAKQR